MEFACRLVFQCLLLVCVVSFSTGCGSDSSGSAADSSLQAVPVSAPQNPGLAVRSDYYTAKVEAELKAAGLKAADFRKGQRLYELYCMNCHAKPNRSRGPDPSKRLAPTTFAVADHYRRAIPDAKERVAAIAKFTAKPTKEDALMPEAIEEFGLMAPMPLSEEQLQDISTFLGTAEFEKPGWYEQHYQKEHGELRQ
jgi:mono/diheme cytochrome c family protein